MCPARREITQCGSDACNGAVLMAMAMRCPGLRAASIWSRQTGLTELAPPSQSWRNSFANGMSCATALKPALPSLVSKTHRF